MTLPPSRAVQFDEAVVRLEPGVTLEQAQAEIDALIAPLRAGRYDVVVLESLRAVLLVFDSHLAAARYLS